MSGVIAAKALFVFTAISLNAADSVDDAQFIRTRTMKQCRDLERSYNNAHRIENDESPPAFKLRWTTDCKVMVLAERRPGV